MFTSGMELLAPSGRAPCLTSLLNTPCNRRHGAGVIDFAFLRSHGKPSDSQGVFRYMDRRESC